MQDEWHNTEGMKNIFFYFKKKIVCTVNKQTVWLQWLLMGAVLKLFRAV
jgi:hypothetical protein